MYLFTLNAIFIHSLMDFDNVFSITTIFWALLSVVNEGERYTKIINKKIIYILILAMILMIYTAIYEICIEAKIGLNQISKLSLNDYRANLYISDINIEKHQNNNDKNKLKISKENLEEAEKLSTNNVVIKWNLAYVYEKLENYEKALEKREEVIKIQGFYQEAYIQHYKLLSKMKNIDKGINCIKKLNELECIYKKNLYNLNKKSIYLKNQIS